MTMLSNGLVRRIVSDWRIKTFGQKFLEILPGDLSLRVNEWIICKLRGRGIERVNPRTRVRKGILNLSLVRQHLGIDLAGATVLELGTGWHGIDLVLFYLSGADRVHTIDRFQYLEEGDLMRSAEVVCEILREGRLPEETTSLIRRVRLVRLNQLARGQQRSNDWFGELGINSYGVPTTRWPELPIPPRSVDFLYSESVLQRLPQVELERIVRTCSRRWLRDGAGFFHRTDQKDIHSQRHADMDRWPLEYLKYPDWLFYTLLNGDLMYQNRLRESDFLRLFTRNGFRVDYLESLRLPEDVQRVRAVHVAERFEGYEPDDLATRSSRILGTVIQGNDRDQSPAVESDQREAWTAL